MIPAIALLTGISSIGGACSVWFHQPKVPEQMKKFK
ncbi:MAG: cyclic lactone autoinducer peptide [Clostridiales bacterium]|nr:cyclic lactone autoinducer peptide [Clostridiales bacterium]